MMILFEGLWRWMMSDYLEGISVGSPLPAGALYSRWVEANDILVMLSEIES